MEILTKVLVGSRLHGLDTPASDYDYRGIHISPLKDVLSPFSKLKNTTWIEGVNEIPPFSATALAVRPMGLYGEYAYLFENFKLLGAEDVETNNG